MSRSTRWLLVSLPTSISQLNDRDEAFGALQACISQGEGQVVPFVIPEFKIGTLDNLVLQAEELTKLEATCQAVTHKVAETLRTTLDSDEDKIEQQKTVNDKPVAAYLNSWSWNKTRYRADKPIGELIDRFSKELSGIDNDIKSKTTQYNQAKTSLAALQRQQQGNLATRSLTSVVPPSLVVRDSEYLETHLIAVPNQQAKDFLKTYETLIDHWIVPRSATQVDTDKEYTLFTVTTFKKYSTDFIHKVREKKWTPRDFKYKDGGGEEEKKELKKTETEERRIWGETLRLARTSYSEVVEDWIHVLALRTFVETVLRYGLPLSFVCGIAKVHPKQMKKVRVALDDAFSFLAGNALGRDKKGRAIKDDMETQMAGGSEEYSPYVCYEFEIN